MPKPRPKSAPPRRLVKPEWNYKSARVPLSRKASLISTLAKELNPGFLKSFYSARLLKEPDFFKSLCRASGLERIGKFVFEGVPVAVKHVGRPGAETDHGRNPGAIRRAFKVHQLAVRSGAIEANNYILRSPKVYGRIGDFLVMEWMNEGVHPRHEGFFARAYEEFRSNLRKLHDQTLSPGTSKILETLRLRQFKNLTVLGNTNPAHPEKGKWVFSFPYDLA